MCGKCSWPRGHSKHTKQTKLSHLMKLTFLIWDVFVDVLFYTTGQMAS